MRLHSGFSCKEFDRKVTGIYSLKASRSPFVHTQTLIAALQGSAYCFISPFLKSPRLTGYFLQLISIQELIESSTGTLTLLLLELARFFFNCQILRRSF